MIATRSQHCGKLTSAKLCSFFQNVPVYVAGYFGFGKDMWGIPPDNITTSLRWLYVTYFAYQLVEGFTQLSILAFYLRLVNSRCMRAVIWGLVAVVASFAIGTYGLNIELLIWCALLMLVCRQHMCHDPTVSPNSLLLGWLARRDARDLHHQYPAVRLRPRRY